MPTYDDNLHVAVDEILSTTVVQKQKTKSAKTAAQYSLYFAQGALIKAKDKLSEVKIKYDKAHLIDNQGIENNNVATNLSATSADVASNVTASVTNMATAAADVQVAAMAIAKLAADVGSAYNLAQASDFNGDIYEMAKRTNHLIQTTSYNAELASQTALEASAATAEIIAPAIVKDVALVQSEIDNVLKITTAEFDKLQTQRSVDNTRVAAASKQERAAEGLLTDAKLEYRSVKATLKHSNKRLNHNLVVTCPPSSTEDISIEISFDKYRYPFPLKSHPEPEQGTPEDSSDAIKYYAVLVSAASKNLFTPKKAETTFNKYKSSRFHEIEANTDNTLPISDTLQDVDGHKIKIGQPYVVFLYIELPQWYKRELNDFSDLLSAPSQEFSPRYQLPLPSSKPVVKQGIKDDSLTLTFSVSKVVKGAEYRCIFIPTNTPPKGVFMTDSSAIVNTSSPAKPEDLGIYFNRRIAEQVPAANYTRAHNTVATNDYVATIGRDTTDNFGNELVKGQMYFVVILAVMGTDNPKYQSEMSSTTDYPIQLVKS